MEKTAAILEEAARVKRGESTKEELEELYANLFGQPSSQESLEEEAYQKRKRF